MAAGVTWAGARAIDCYAQSNVHWRIGESEITIRAHIDDFKEGLSSLNQHMFGSHEPNTFADGWL